MTATGDVLERFVKTSYRAVADVDGVGIWRRKGCDGAGTRHESAPGQLAR
jgi:hypothetical protein